MTEPKMSEFPKLGCVQHDCGRCERESLWSSLPLKDHLRAVERQRIINALWAQGKHQHARARAGKTLGLTSGALRQRMLRLGIL